MLTAPDPSAPFGELFGHLIQVLRGTPERQELVREALDRLVARVATGPALLEAGIENSWAVDGDVLKERLQIRQVDAIHVAQGAGTAELLALARALAREPGEAGFDKGQTEILLARQNPACQAMVLGDPFYDDLKGSRLGQSCRLNAGRQPLGLVGLGAINPEQPDTA